jgi:hypothetical protein
VPGSGVVKAVTVKDSGKVFRFLECRPFVEGFLESSLRRFGKRSGALRPRSVRAEPRGSRLGVPKTRWHPILRLPSSFVIPRNLF